MENAVFAAGPSKQFIDSTPNHPSALPRYKGKPPLGSFTTESNYRPSSTSNPTPNRKNAPPPSLRSCDKPVDFSASSPPSATSSPRHGETPSTTLSPNAVKKSSATIPANSPAAPSKPKCSPERTRQFAPQSSVSKLWRKARLAACFSTFSRHTWSFWSRFRSETQTPHSQIEKES